MMPNTSHQPVPVLGRSAQVQVSTIHLLPLAGLRFRAGGCDYPGKVISCEMVDVPNGAQFIAPLDIGYAERLHKQLGELITEHNRRTLEG